MDISGTVEPNSDQLDAVDLIGGPRTFTITEVTKGNAEQPVQIRLAEFPRVWRPGKSMRRVLIACWGKDASAYVGRRVTLYCDEEVQFGGMAVGGTRISALSHIDGVKKIPLLVSRGKSKMFVVEPLTESAPALPTPADIAAATDLPSLETMWNQFPDGHKARAAITARVNELKAASAEDSDDPNFPPEE